LDTKNHSLGWRTHDAIHRFLPDEWSDKSICGRFWLFFCSDFSRPTLSVIVKGGVKIAADGGVKPRHPSRTIPPDTHCVNSNFSLFKHLLKAVYLAL
jgi:hypothetical protein